MRKNELNKKNQTEIKTRLTFATNVISCIYSCVNVAKNYYVILVSIEYLQIFSGKKYRFFTTRHDKVKIDVSSQEDSYYSQY